MARERLVATLAGCRLVAWTFLRRPSAPAAATLGAATAFFYAVHHRGLSMVVTTAGLLAVVAVLGVAFLVSMAAGRQPAPDVPGSPQQGLAAYLVVTMAAMASASVLQIATHTRVDHLVYGRYNEGFLPVLLVAGGAWTHGEP